MTTHHDQEPNGDQLFADSLEQARRAILGAAIVRRDLARRLDVNAYRVAKERYIITDEMEVPYLNERIRITPVADQPRAESFAPPFKELFMYFPMDTPFKDGPGEYAAPTIIFLKLVSTEGQSTGYIISKYKTSILPGDEVMRVDAGHLGPANDLTEVMDFLPERDEQFEEIDHLFDLEGLRHLVADTEKYRLTAQTANPRAA